MLNQLRSPISPKTRDAALLGFVLAAISAALSLLCYVEMTSAADVINSLSPRTSPGGTAFALNLPLILWEISALGTGFVAAVCLLATWMWLPRTTLSWYSVAGLLCLVPATALFAAICGWLRLNP